MEKDNRPNRMEHGTRKRRDRPRGIACRYCGKVGQHRVASYYDHRPTNIRIRQRVCSYCFHRFTTEERVIGDSRPIEEIGATEKLR